MENSGEKKKHPTAETTPSSSSAAPLGPAILISGFLTKRTRTMNRWTRRWWQLLDTGTLLYFKGEERTTLLGEIDIGQSCYDVRLGAETCKVVFPRVAPSCCCFAFSVLKRTYYVHAPTAAEAKRWVECINNVSSVLNRDRQRNARHRPAPSRPHSVCYTPSQAAEKKKHVMSHKRDQHATNKRHSIAIADAGPHEELYRLDLECRDKPGDLPVFVTMRKPRPRSTHTLPSATTHRQRHRSVPVWYDSTWEGEPHSSLSASLWLDGTPQVSPHHQPVTSSPGSLRTQSPYLQTSCTTPPRGSRFASYGGELNTLHLGRPVMTEITRGGSLPRPNRHTHRSMSSLPYPQSTFGKELEKLEEREAILRKRLAMMEDPPRPASVAWGMSGLGNPYSRPSIGVPVLPQSPGIRHGSLEFIAHRNTNPPPPVKPKPKDRGNRSRPPTFVTATRLLPISSPTESASSVTVNTATITGVGDRPQATPPIKQNGVAFRHTYSPQSPWQQPTAGMPPQMPHTTQSTTPNEQADKPSPTQSQPSNSLQTTSPEKPLSPFTPSSASPQQTSQFWGLDGQKSSDARVRDANIWARNELQKLVAKIKQLGSVKEEGKIVITFHDLQEGTNGVFEALLGTLCTAKKHQIIDFDGEVLLKGRDDGVCITLLKEEL